MSEFMPIGTVVTLQENSKFKFMIVGYYPTNKEGECRDYTAIRYPMGVYDNRLFFFFNKEDVHEVLHMGYTDDDFTSMIALLKYFKEKQQQDCSKEGEENG